MIKPKMQNGNTPDVLMIQDNEIALDVVRTALKSQRNEGVTINVFAIGPNYRSQDEHQALHLGAPEAEPLKELPLQSDGVLEAITFERALAKYLETIPSTRRLAHIRDVTIKIAYDKFNGRPGRMAQWLDVARGTARKWCAGIGEG